MCLFETEALQKCFLIHIASDNDSVLSARSNWQVESRANREWRVSFLIHLVKKRCLHVVGGVKRMVQSALGLKAPESASCGGHVSRQQADCTHTPLRWNWHLSFARCSSMTTPTQHFPNKGNQWYMIYMIYHDINPILCATVMFSGRKINPIFPKYWKAIPRHLSWSSVCRGPAPSAAPKRSANAQISDLFWAAHGTGAFCGV